MSASRLVFDVILFAAALGMVFLCWVMLHLVRESSRSPRTSASVERIRRRIVARRIPGKGSGPLC